MNKNITIAISHYVRQGMESAFEEALEKVIQQAKLFKGYEGIQIIKPNNKNDNEYLLLIRFDEEANYRAWEHSDIRKNWSKELHSYIHKESQVRHQEGLEFWFSSPGGVSPKPPVKWKMALLTWMVIYPLIILFSMLATTYLGFLQPPLRMLLVSMVLVSAMTYFLMPGITKLFAGWIFPKKT